MISYTLLNAKQATGLDKIAGTVGFRDLSLEFNVSGQENAADEITIKVLGSSQETPPTFTSATSATNRWDYIQIKDLEDGSSIDGDTGVTWTNTNETRKFAVNVDDLNWLAVVVTTYTDANTSGKITCVANLQNEER